MSTDDDQPRDVSLENLLEIAHRSLVDGLRTSLPGQITDYDATQQRASVQILIQHGEIVAGDRQVAPLPIVNDVPVWFLGGSRGRITWPVAVGDVCLVMWASSSLALWKKLGGVVDPGDDTRHRISDCVCLVGGHSFNAVPTDAPTDAIVTHGLTRLGGSDAVEDVVVESALDTFGLALNSAIASCLAEMPPNTMGADALSKLASALGIDPITGEGWLAGTTETKAK